MERTPVKTIPIHEHLRPRLCDTYENDSIFDKFEVVFSGDAKNVMTGSYNNNFMIYPSDPEKDTEVVLQADKSAFKAKKVGIPTPMNSSSSPTGGKKGGSRAGSPAAGAGQGQRMRKETDADQIDFNKKILHMSWHPFEDSIAIAATNNVSSFPVLDRVPCLTSSSFSSSPLCKNLRLEARLVSQGHSPIEAFACLFLDDLIYLLPHLWRQPAQRRHGGRTDHARCTGAKEWMIDDVTRIANGRMMAVDWITTIMTLKWCKETKKFSK
jgi:hypothetical protein